MDVDLTYQVFKFHNVKDARMALCLFGRIFEDGEYHVLRKKNEGLWEIHVWVDEDEYEFIIRHLNKELFGSLEEDWDLDYDKLLNGE